MFYGLDVHKEFIQVCELDPKGAKRKEYRIGGTAEEIDRWAQSLSRRDQVVLEINDPERPAKLSEPCRIRSREYSSPFSKGP